MCSREAARSSSAIGRGKRRLRRTGIRGHCFGRRRIVLGRRPRFCAPRRRRCSGQRRWFLRHGLRRCSAHAKRRWKGQLHVLRPALAWPWCHIEANLQAGRWRSAGGVGNGAAVDSYAQIVQGIDPHAALVGRWPLRGGVSAHVEVLELELAGGGTRRVVLRRHGAAAWKVLTRSNCSMRCSQQGSMSAWGLEPEREADMQRKAQSVIAAARAALLRGD